MLETNLKALIVVLAISALTFLLLRPIALRFMTKRDFARRRNGWLILTVAAFLSPNFWIFVPIATLVIAWLASDDPNPLALYLFLVFVIPPSRYLLDNGTFGIADLNIYRLLTLVILVPWAFRNFRSIQPDPSGRRRLLDRLILVFGVIHVLSKMPYEPFTRTTLHSILYLLDVYFLYFVASRSCTRKEQIVEILACFALACALLAPLGAFESLRTWQLYGGIEAAWGGEKGALYRDGTLRALVTTGHSLGLGYFCGIAFGAWLYLGRQIGSAKLTAAGAVWMWVGLIAAYSRAPWLMGVLLYLSFVFFASSSAAKLAKVLLLIGLAGTVVAISPYGDRIADVLPFVGTVDARNVEYRQRLITVTWIVMQENLWFGDRFATQGMEEMINGQGIVDLVNAYAATALMYGLVGLAIYCAAQLAALVMAFKSVRQMKSVDASHRTLAATLLACMIATVFFELTSGSMWMQYVIIGLIVAHARLCDAAAGRARAHGQTPVRLRTDRARYV